MAVSLSKEQINQLSRYIRLELEKIGDEQRTEAVKAAIERFYKTKEGKMLAHLRMKFPDVGRNCGFGEEILEQVRKVALKKWPKPFSFGYGNSDDITRRVVLLSIDATSGQELIDRVKREYCAKLKPGVRKLYNIKLK